MTLTGVQLGILLSITIFLFLTSLVGLVLSLLRKQQESKALTALIKQLSEQEETRKKKLSETLTSGFHLNKAVADKTANTLLQHEKAFYQIIIDIFGHGETIKLSQLGESISHLLDQYTAITPGVSQKQINAIVAEHADHSNNDNNETLQTLRRLFDEYVKIAALTVEKDKIYCLAEIEALMGWTPIEAATDADTGSEEEDQDDREPAAETETLETSKDN